MTAGRLPRFLPESIDGETLYARILRLLVDFSGTAREIAMALGLTKPSVGSALSKLASHGRIAVAYTHKTRTHRLVAVYWL